MSPSPRISTLLPTNVLNPWVDQAVRSALAQEHVDHEVVVIHDGIQPDASRVWVQDPRVRCVITGVSQGLAHALRLGARHATGQYIARLDGDDLCRPTRLTEQLALMESQPDVVLCGTLARRIDHGGMVTGQLGTTAGGDLRVALLARNVLIHSSAFFSREVYELAGGYDSRLTQMEDYHLWLRMATFGQVQVVQRHLVDYRVHAGQMSRGASPRGAYIGHVLGARLELAKRLGQPLVLQRARDEAWKLAQTARYRGWRTPGYAR